MKSLLLVALIAVCMLTPAAYGANSKYPATRSAVHFDWTVGGSTLRFEHLQGWIAIPSEAVQAHPPKTYSDWRPWESDAKGGRWTPSGDDWMPMERNQISCITACTSAKVSIYDSHETIENILAIEDILIVSSESGHEHHVIGYGLNAQKEPDILFDLFSKDLPIVFEDKNSNIHVTISDISGISSKKIAYIWDSCKCKCKLNMKNYK